MAQRSSSTSDLGDLLKKWEAEQQNIEILEELFNETSSNIWQAGTCDRVDKATQTVSYLDQATQTDAS